MSAFCPSAPCQLPFPLPHALTVLPFRQQTLEDLLNDQLEKHEKSQRASTAASVRTQSKEKKESGCSSAASSAPSAPAPAAAKPPQPTDSARAPDPVQGVIARHIADFLDSLPAHVAPESVTLRQLKKALQVHFTNWVGLLFLCDCRWALPFNWLLTLTLNSLSMSYSRVCV